MLRSGVPTVFISSVGNLAILLILLVGCKIRTHEQKGLVFGDPVEGNGVVISEKREVSEFDNILNYEEVEIILESGEGPLRVQADSNLIPLIETKVGSQTLSIDLKERVLAPKALRVHVPVENVISLRNRGSGSFLTKERLRWSDLTIRNRGSGGIDLDLSADRISYYGKNSGDLELRGKAQTLSIKNEGSGDVEASKLEAQKVFCKNTGSGDIWLNAVLKTDIENSGSGDVLYKESTPNMKVERSGAGEVREMRNGER